MRASWRNSLLLVLSLASVLFVGAGPGDEARFNKVGHRLMCVCGCNQVLLECNHVGCSYSDRMRDEIVAGLRRGDSDDLVLQGFVQKYGNTVLAAPTTTGFNRVAWIMPFVVFAAATGLVILMVRRWTRQPAIAVAADAPIADGHLDDLRKRARQETEF